MHTFQLDYNLVILILISKELVIWFQLSVMSYLGPNTVPYSTQLYIHEASFFFFPLKPPEVGFSDSLQWKNLNYFKYKQLLSSWSMVNQQCTRTKKDARRHAKIFTCLSYLIITRIIIWWMWFTKDREAGKSSSRSKFSQLVSKKERSEFQLIWC